MVNDKQRLEYNNKIFLEATHDFQQKLQRILQTWDGQSTFDVLVKLTVTPRIQYDVGESRQTMSTELLRYLLHLINNNQMKFLILLVQLGKGKVVEVPDDWKNEYDVVDDINVQVG